MYYFNIHRFKQFAKENGLSAVEIANNLKNASHVTVRRWMEGGYPTTCALIEFCNVFKTNLLEFFYEDEEQMSSQKQSLSSECTSNTIPNYSLETLWEERNKIRIEAKKEIQNDLNNEIERIENFYEKRLKEKDKIISELQSKIIEISIKYGTSNSYSGVGLAEEQTFKQYDNL